MDHRDLDLRIVAREDVLLHEQTDPHRVERLVQALRNDTFLRNPPVVAEADGLYVVLDGATRTTALSDLDCRHLVVQVVPYSTHVRLEAWYHLLPESTAKEVIRGLEAHGAANHDARAQVVSLDSAHIALDSREATAAVVVSENEAYLLRASAREANTALRTLVHSYGSFGEVHRIVNDDLQRVVRSEENVGAVVLFPPWKPEEIIRAAIEKDLLPAGITRHVIPGRVLNVNVSLDILQLEATLVAKSEWLERWLTQKIMAKKVRFYHESVFVFDD